MQEFNILKPDTLIHNHYRIQDTVVKGGMGVVYKAFDTRTKQLVAVKQVLIPGDAAHTKQAFEREARLLNRLQHPHLPRVTDFFDDDDKPGNFLVMEFISGYNLAYLLQLQRRPFTVDEVREFAHILLGLLHYLHTRTPPVLHRDIKPENLMLTDDEKLYLVDFGLAVERTHGQQTTGRTRHYAPPEQVAGATVNDPRSDFYALGATLYTLLTEELPADSLDRQQALDAGHPDPLRSARTINPQVRADLSNALSKMMALNINERPATIEEMQTMFNLPMTGRRRQAVPTTPLPIPDASPSELHESETDVEQVLTEPTVQIFQSFRTSTRIAIAFSLTVVVSIVIVISLFLRLDLWLIGAIVLPVTLLLMILAYVHSSSSSSKKSSISFPSSSRSSTFGEAYTTSNEAKQTPQSRSTPRRRRFAVPTDPLPVPPPRSSYPEHILEPEQLVLAWLVVLSGEQQGQQFAIINETSIGRSPENDIVFPSAGLSRHHARVSFKEESFILEDLGSSNGTFVNGNYIESHQLKHGDLIRIGEAILRFFQTVSADEATIDAKKRIEQFDGVWNNLLQAVKNGIDKSQFTTQSSKIMHELLHDAVGYNIEYEISFYRGVYGFMVEATLLWISHSRFPILFVAYDQRNSDILLDIVKQLEAAKATEYFALLIVVPTSNDTGSEAQELRYKVSRSPYSHDFVVLDRQHLTSIIARNSSQRLIEVILEQGIELSALSPYVVRGPVPEKMFFGREQEIKTIVQGIRSSDYALVSGRRMGKSSTLLRISRMLNNDHRYQAIYVNCEDVSNAEDFLDVLSDDAGVQNDNGSPLTFRNLIKAIEAKEPSKTIVFLLDEIDALLDTEAQLASGGQLFKTFRVLSHQAACRFVFSGSRTLYQHLHNPKSPFFNFCIDIALKPLQERGVSEIVSKPMHQLGIDMPEEDKLINQIQDLTSCHPNLVQWICDRLLKTTSERRIGLSDLEQIVNSQDFLRHFVETAWGEANSLEKLITLLMRDGAFTLNQVLEALKHYDIEDRMKVRESLEILELYSLVEHDDEQYRFVLAHFPQFVRAHEDVDALIAALLKEMEV